MWPIVRWLVFVFGGMCLLGLLFGCSTVEQIHDVDSPLDEAHRF